MSIYYRVLLKFLDLINRENVIFNHVLFNDLNKSFDVNAKF